MTPLNSILNLSDFILSDLEHDLVLHRDKYLATDPDAQDEREAIQDDIDKIDGYFEQM